MLAAGEANLLVHICMSFRLFDLDVVGLDDLRPPIDLGLHECAELDGLHRDRNGAELLPPHLHLRPPDALVHPATEAIDARLRRADWRHDAKPDRRLVRYSGL